VKRCRVFELARCCLVSEDTSLDKVTGTFEDLKTDIAEHDCGSDARLRGFETVTLAESIEGK
jgi:hypothetical protein